jgi:hypothetical protein
MRWTSLIGRLYIMHVKWSSPTLGSNAWGALGPGGDGQRTSRCMVARRSPCAALQLPPARPQSTLRCPRRGRGAPWCTSWTTLRATRSLVAATADGGRRTRRPRLHTKDWPLATRVSGGAHAHGSRVEPARRRRSCRARRRGEGSVDGVGQVAHRVERQVVAPLF